MVFHLVDRKGGVKKDSRVVDPVSDESMNIILSRAPAEHHNYRNRTTCMHRNRNPYNSFFMVNMASGMDRGRARPTTTTTFSPMPMFFAALFGAYGDYYNSKQETKQYTENLIAKL